MNHGRAHWFEPGELDAEQRQYYDRLLASPRTRDEVTDERGRLRGPHNARLLDPSLGMALQELATMLRFSGREVSPLLRELAILEVARAERSGIEWRSHARRARALGFTVGELEALRDREEPSTFGPDKQLVLRVVRALVERGDLDDTLFDEAEERLGLKTLFFLITLVGHYRHTALALRVWRVPMSDDDPVGFPAGEQLQSEDRG